MSDDEEKSNIEMQLHDVVMPGNVPVLTNFATNEGVASTNNALGSAFNSAGRSNDGVLATPPATPPATPSPSPTSTLGAAEEDRRTEGSDTDNEMSSGSDIDLTDEESQKTWKINVGDLVHRYRPRHRRRKDVGIIQSLNEKTATVLRPSTTAYYGNTRLQTIPTQHLMLSIPAKDISGYIMHQTRRKQIQIKRLFEAVNKVEQQQREQQQRVREQQRKQEQQHERIYRDMDQGMAQLESENMRLKATAPGADMKRLMENTINNIKVDQNFINCRCQIIAYQNHNSCLRDHMRERLVVLDYQYKVTRGWINQVQISIIVASTGSAFIQASENTTHLNKSLIGFLTLCIATYTGLLLTVSKYMKFDEKKERIHSLQQQFAEFIVKLETRDDQLNTWCSDNFWAGHKIEDKREEWKQLEVELKSGFKSLIERKAYLCCEFEKQFDSEIQLTHSWKVRFDALRTKRKKNKLQAQELKAKQEGLWIGGAAQDMEDGRREEEEKRDKPVFDARFTPKMRSGEDIFASKPMNMH